VKLIKKILVGAAILACLAVAAVVTLVSWRYTTVARLKADPDIRFIVHTDTAWHIDPMRSYYYEVRRSWTTIVPLSYIGSTNAPDRRFGLVATPDKKVVGLVESRSPYLICALFAADTNETWPHASGRDLYSDVSERGRRLFTRFRDALPEPQKSLYTHGDLESEL
jgi:hypothetical protein